MSSEGSALEDVENVSVSVGVIAVGELVVDGKVLFDKERPDVELETTVDECPEL